MFWPERKQAKRSRRANLALATQGKEARGPGALETARTRRRTATHLCCDVDRCPDNPGRDMAIFVRCIDNALAADVLVVGEIYEVMHINERDGYYALSVHHDPL